MTNDRDTTHGDNIRDDNPLLAALPPKEELRQAFLASSTHSLQHDHASDPMDAACFQTVPRRQLEVESSLRLLAAVHDSLLDSYRPRNPLAATTPGDRLIAFESAPTTFLAWETGADMAAKNVFDRVLGSLPTVIDHVEFNSRPFIARQLVHTSITVDPLDVVRDSCRQIVKATDLAFETRHADRLCPSTPKLAFALNAAQACERTFLGLLGIHVPTPLTEEATEDLCVLATLFQLRCGIALLVSCSGFAAMRMAKGGPLGRRLLNAKLFGMKRRHPLFKEEARHHPPDR